LAVSDSPFQLDFSGGDQMHELIEAARSSRKAVPEPFMRVADGQRLLQKAFLRAAIVPGVSDVLVVANREYYFQTGDEFNDLGDAVKGIGPIFSLNRSGGTHEIEAREGEGAIMLVPADHKIADRTIQRCSWRGTTAGQAKPVGNLLA
jgi:mannose-1-phosphate guanylyltransferase